MADSNHHLGIPPWFNRNNQKKKPSHGHASSSTGRGSGSTKAVSLLICSHCSIAVASYLSIGSKPTSCAHVYCCFCYSRILAMTTKSA